MAKQISWTNQAKADRISILDFYRRRNKSTSYSKKKSTEFLSVKSKPFPNIQRLVKDQTQQMSGLKSQETIIQFI